MSVPELPVPRLMTAHNGPLHHLEKVILNEVASIERWFQKKWLETPAPITSSVDLRHSGFKLAPVDTNLFPAGFNNINPDSLSLCVQAVQASMADYFPGCQKILMLPESHTRNRYYMQSLAVLKKIFIQAGFLVRIASLDPEITTPLFIDTDNGEHIIIEPLVRIGDKAGLVDFDPCMLLLNNDLSTGVPAILQGLQQRICPTEKLGWSSRLKSSHFQFFDEVVAEFTSLVNLDPWFINPYFDAVSGLDFMAQEGVDTLASAAEKLLQRIRDKYAQYGIKEKPYIAVKADNGTYGMSVMMVQDADELRQLNRKQRSRMAVSKGTRKVDRVILQEGVYSFEVMADGAVAEPVVYMLGQFVVGGFYRVHHDKASNENLNAPGMHFEPLAFASACNTPLDDRDSLEYPNRFYVYGVIARLAALAAAREIAATGDSL